ncbi:4-hydroxythreonine-4-phosphate dehydrogenase [Allopseudospirillum japonicum]|uniref:4-hydroxythreonine-4-phosphate dehydrogenase n=1 Tax=Allopseudospirillum japonicum TaxID=64971 RepID=A0A1H6T3M2_9GAMM|nr:4-hydroxythreonine-4-phosphate dehydrogenase PdxA [Allopseudospirillum japonicum]SEI74703.1 4-hydroxythreonine-4-phosphate dehydrogenase [Allopseudospirillum japonicum]
MSQPAILALTTGEPAGIGPDLALQWMQEYQQLESTEQTQWDHTRVLVLANADVLQARARQLGIGLKPYWVNTWQALENLPPLSSGYLPVWSLPIQAPVMPGELNPANATYVLDMLTLAAQGCMEKRFAGMVTAPVHKGVINDAGVDFSGHTEFLQMYTGSRQVVMMLATARLRVALVTTHLPLRAVADAITQEKLQQVLEILYTSLQQQWGIAQPKILVCGLNPHAGEGGHLGDEEIQIIEPVLQTYRDQGKNIVGPLPADTLFTEKVLHGADAVLAMYHDQGLPVLKHQGFGQAANITLGLPIVRTSVDHGTALELAGRGQAHTGSLWTALQAARVMRPLIF